MNVGTNIDDMSIFVSVADTFMSAPMGSHIGLHVGPRAIHVGMDAQSYRFK